MATLYISRELMNRVIRNAQKIDENEKKVLYLLRNLGPQRFTNLMEYTQLSRSTVSKYLKFHVDKRNVEKRMIEDRRNQTQFQGYHITEKGIEALREEFSQQEDEFFYINELNENITKLSDLIEFYRDIGVDESITFHIVRIISKIGDIFFQIEQNRELYLSIFYMFYNSILGQGTFASKFWHVVATSDLKDTNKKQHLINNLLTDFKCIHCGKNVLDDLKKEDKEKEIEPFTGYKLNIDQFCEVYNVKKLHIDFYVDKIMSNNLGFFMIFRGNDVFFFHEEDLLGTTTLRLIKDRLIEEIIYINRKGYRKIYDLDKMTEDIAEQLKNMGLIWDDTIQAFDMGIQKEFEVLIEKLIIKNAIEMGFSKTLLMEMVIQSEKLSKSKEGKNFLKKILEGSAIYEDLNVVQISDAREAEEEEDIEEDTALDAFLEQVKGFCSNCGKIIPKSDPLKECTKCGLELDEKKLLKSIDAANEASMRYKQETLVEEELITCPNPKCGMPVLPSWEICPHCNKKM